MDSMLDIEIYACDSDGYAEYFSTIEKKKGTETDKISKKPITKKRIKSHDLSK